MTHLWESDHPYYASEGNYYSNECHAEYRTWSDFMEEEGDSDVDMNLVYRWDWRPPENGGVLGTLSIYIVGQRKALHRSVAISAVHPDEEADIRAWLAPRWEQLRKMWEPLASEESVPANV